MDRIQLIAMLLTEEERLNSSYIADEMDRDTWTKSLQSVDDRLAVLGIRLGHRPWETTAGSSGGRF